VTTLLATASDTDAIILSESQVSDDYSYIRMPSDNIKVVKNGNWIVAGAGWSRPHDVVQYVMKWPNVPLSVVTQGQQAITIWIIKNVIPKLTSILEKNKSIDLDKGTAAINDSEFLLATHGYLFVLDGSFGVTPIQNYFVAGSGGKIALGAIAVQKDLYPSKWNKEHGLMNKRAIEQAIKYDLYSSGAIRGYVSSRMGKVDTLVFNNQNNF
jgi:ATP-dependent protease HslVU (ClpYQ) peptidase subunit